MDETDWVSVDEQLPSPGTWVVAWKGQFEDQIRSDILPFKIVQAWLIRDEQLREAERITHWLAIPHPPRVEFNDAT